VTRSRKVRTVILFALCGSAFAVGALVLTVHVRGELLYLGSRSWPTTTGKVIYSAAQTETTPWIDNPRSIHGTFRPPGKIHFGVVEYRYVVDGQAYVSRVEVSGMGESRSVVSQFSRGSRVNVFYDPSDPKRSALIPGIDKNYVIFQLILVATVFTMGGIGLRGTLRYLRRR
jgi:hypothetical protein